MRLCGVVDMVCMLPVPTRVQLPMSAGNGWPMCRGNIPYTPFDYYNNSLLANTADCEAYVARPIAVSCGTCSYIYEYECTTELMYPLAD